MRQEWGRLAGATAIVALALIAGGCTGAAGTPSPPTFASPAPIAPTAAVTGVVDCSGASVQRPATITLECGDGKDTLLDLRWSSWTPTRADATGEEEVTECVPNCAEGRPSRTPVTVVLTDDRPSTQGRPEHYFARAVISGTQGSRSELLNPG